MARKRTIRVSALNITLHPHTPQHYIDLLETVRDQQISANYYGDRNAIIGYLSYRYNEDPEEGIDGQIFTYIDFSPNEPWLNTATGEEAGENELEEAHLPERLKPGMKRFNFAFFPREHRLFFESRSHEGNTLGPSSARRIFERLFSAEDVLNRFGKSEVVVEPTQEALDKILEMPKLKKLTIHVTRPNADDEGGETEREVLERLNIEHAESRSEEVKARDDESLTPDRRSQTLAGIAQSNGFVEGRGRNDDGEAITESTKDHPLVEPTEYFPDRESPTEVLWELSKDLLRKIMNRD